MPINPPPPGPYEVLDLRYLGPRVWALRIPCPVHQNVPAWERCGRDSIACDERWWASLQGATCALCGEDDRIQYRSGGGRAGRAMFAALLCAETWHGLHAHLACWACLGFSRDEPLRWESLVQRAFALCPDHAENRAALRIDVAGRFVTEVAMPPPGAPEWRGR
jgi:hypothetical protein